MLVSNEGNARLASSLPPVHIIIAGIDKLVRNLSDATVMMEALRAFQHPQLVTRHLEEDREPLLRRIVATLLAGLKADASSP